MKSTLFVAAAIMMFVAVPRAQQPTSSPPAREDQVVRISTDLIQIDVTVTDKNGKTVTGLAMDDFEVFENGEKQNLSGAYFVAKASGGATAGGNAQVQSQTNTVPGAPQTPLAASGSVRRTIAIVVDDLNMSFASVYYARRSLRKFVEQQMEPGDLVAIIRTAGAVGALQQFTSNKQLLLAAVDAIRWNPISFFINPALIFSIPINWVN